MITRKNESRIVTKDRQWEFEFKFDGRISN